MLMFLSLHGQLNKTTGLRLAFCNVLFHVTYKAPNKALHSHPCMGIAILHSARGDMLKGLTSAECQTWPRHRAGELGLIAYMAVWLATARTKGRPL